MISFDWDPGFNVRLPALHCRLALCGHRHVIAVPLPLQVAGGHRSRRDHHHGLHRRGHVQGDERLLLATGSCSQVWKVDFLKYYLCIALFDYFLSSSSKYFLIMDQKKLNFIFEKHAQLQITEEPCQIEATVKYFHFHYLKGSVLTSSSISSKSRQF